MSARIEPQPPKHKQPPLWMPLLVAGALAVLLLGIALPTLGHGPVSWARTLFLSSFLFWVLPLTLLQRTLWARGVAVTLTIAIILGASLAMAMISKLTSQLMQQGSVSMDPWFFLRGLEGPCLALLVYAALHAVVAHAWALREARERLLGAQAMARDAELRALRMQLQPHFLFNTLNAVSAQVGDGQTRAAQDMLARLADFLRATLESNDQHQVVLAEELALAEAYLDIEKLRIGPRMQLQRDIGPGALDALVPSLLLQPLLENALRHGLALRRQPGRLLLRIQQLGTHLQVLIQNDLPEVGEDSVSRQNGLGLKNLAARLEQLYNGRAKMTAGRDESGNFSVSVLLPLIYRSDRR
jgi:two-component system, LytTR family, sensor histidine kinase AlgZ